MAEVWKRIGQVLKGKEGKGHYIKIREDVVLKKDSFIQLQDPRENLKRLLEKQSITNEEYNTRVAKIPDFVKYELVVPPPRN